jgi:hypothetical protein
MLTASNVPLPPPAIAEWVREVAAAQDPRVGPTTPVVPLLTRGLPTRPYAPAHSQVYICAGVIVKLHSPAANRDRLARRIHCIGGPDIDRLWIQPLIYAPFDAPGNRLATVWPRVTVLATIDRPPWTEIGTLLAKLHRMPIRDDPPRLGGHTRLHLAIDHLRAHGGAELRWLVERGEHLASQLAEPAQVTLAHGDFHLGQLGHTPLRRSWKLLDVDDFGTGDPAWDLASPAGYWAAGLLDDEAWTEFLDAYRQAGGTAVAQTGDPWPSLNVPAQAAVLIAVSQQLRAGSDLAAVEPLLQTARRLHAQS